MDSRRCTSESCQVAAARMARFDVPVASVLFDPQVEWARTAYGGGRRVARAIEVDWDEFNRDDYLFSHCTIVSSVQVETDESKPGAGYYIDPVCSGLVNNNGNAWTDPVLLATFGTFRGAQNYLEHVQIPELSKGRILDAVVRPVRYKDDEGREASVSYVDILVATSKRHGGLVGKIASGEMNAMSMGCFMSGTRVLMADGTTKAIEDVMVGERVRTHSGASAEVESCRVRFTSDGETRRLGVSGVPDTFVTGEHPYWTLTGHDRCPGCGGDLPKKRAIASNGLSALDKKSWCSHSCMQSNFNSYSPAMQEVAVLVEQEVKFDWVKTEDLLVGDYVAVPLGRPKAERSCLDKARCQILGFYAAEGNIQRDANGLARATEFTFGLGESVVEDLISALRDCGVADEAVYRQDRKRDTGDSTRVVVHDAGLALWLLESCGEHCDGKVLAPWVMGLDDNSLLVILGAYIDGDGHCRKDSARFSTSSCSRRLSEQVWSMMTALGIPASFNGPYEKDGRRPYWMVVSRKGHASRLEGRCRKYRKQRAGRDRISSFHGHMLRRVTTNERLAGCYPVYNMHVVNDRGDHSYVANWNAVHNCLAHKIQCSKCGVILADEDPNCVCIESELMRPFVDENGVRRMTAELCGVCLYDQNTGKLARDENGNLVGDPKSLDFIEASWVGRPAFGGAVLNHFLSDVPMSAAKVLRMDAPDLELVANDIFRMRVADAAGMMVLRVARAEMIRRRRMEMAMRVARGFWRFD